jgi:hypothetical protein
MKSLYRRPLRADVPRMTFSRLACGSPTAALEFTSELFAC